MLIFSQFVRPLILTILLPCIIISILEIYYVTHKNISWKIFERIILDSPNWWIFGIPLSGYALIWEISLLVTVALSYKEQLGMNEKEFQGYSELQKYPNSEKYQDLYKGGYDLNSVTFWIDSISIWNRLTFLMVNIAIYVNFYLIFLMYFQFQTYSILTLANFCLFFIIFILNWYPGLLSNFMESLKLTGICFIISLILILCMYFSNLESQNSIVPFIAENLNIPVLSKEEDELNRRIIKRFIESGGILYGMHGSPSTAINEMIWGKSSIQLLKDTKSYVECSFTVFHNKEWKTCIENHIDSYPSWVVGDRKITGIVKPQIIAFEINLDLEKMRRDVLIYLSSEQSVQNDDNLQKEIANSVDDSVVESDEETDLNKNDTDYNDDNIEKSSSYDKKGKYKKKGKKYREDKKNANLLNIENLYDQPLLRGVTNIKESLKGEEPEDITTLIEPPDEIDDRLQGMKEEVRQVRSIEEKNKEIELLKKELEEQRAIELELEEDTEKDENIRDKEQNLTNILENKPTDLLLNSKVQDNNSPKLYDSTNIEELDLEKEHSEVDQSKTQETEINLKPEFRSDLELWKSNHPIEESNVKTQDFSKKNKEFPNQLNIKSEQNNETDTSNGDKIKENNISELKQEVQLSNTTAKHNNLMLKNSIDEIQQRDGDNVVSGFDKGDLN
ncbi:uncharacterized protein CMU_019480 [Cryptosporidium muris RN66]|uniref:Uncharacterized protein n=1 Tax=Cryptosporidium muris (strain RN66) TaxID=441375 RepID=B6ACD5_CRYMR|nr:uncharacterized protein CMU_019480 [Cryptosporidium muris RN66]EEA06191.1 hypothetical protein, conserved [Cryptosporidium muris RN66]|eukprot:XP_002140540.1 hypothetical protein [Cryptosporidium muris RN66]